ncbi:MAG: TusE/DsrC/DsvC family sulfur relay protein [Proteobacteria bacterium]|nr:TusE/DsrC/DsvC family sulfur relay protein [Pseudomonadota bacterium]
MLDINKVVNDPNLLSHDPEGHMYDLKHWSREIAQNQARAEGLGELSETQWRVIHALRGLYRKNGRAESARQLVRALETDFAIEGGRRHLYEMFPDGPVTQGSRIAGVPPPPNSSDPSFGWLG